MMHVILHMISHAIKTIPGTHMMGSLSMGAILSWYPIGRENKAGHDDLITWKCFLQYWLSVGGIHSLAWWQKQGYCWETPIRSVMKSFQVFFLLVWTKIQLPVIWDIVIPVWHHCKRIKPYLWNKLTGFLNSNVITFTYIYTTILFK